MSTPKCFALAVAGLFTGAAFAQEGLNAKSLFFGTDGSVVSVPTAAPGRQPEPVAAAAGTRVASAKRPAANIGAGYFIRLKNADGSHKDVLANRSFASGERFQLGVKVNRPTYVYIYNEDADGKVTQLYPQPGQSNFVDAMGVVFLPAQGAFQFDDKPGTEQLSVLLSPRVVDDPGARIVSAQPDLVSDPTRKVAAARSHCDAEPGREAAGSTQVAMADTSGGAMASKGIAYSPSADNCMPQPALSSKAIFFSEDPAPSAGGQVASYVVKPQKTPSDSLLLKIKLLHR